MATAGGLRELEEKVIAFEASTDGRAAGCGGLSYFNIWEHRRRFGSRDPVALGRIAPAWGGNTVIAGPADRSQAVYQVFEDPGIDNGQDETGTHWQRAVVTPTMGIPIPYGAMSVVWADTQLVLSYHDRVTGRATLGLFDRFGVSGPAPAMAIASVSFERGVPADIVLEDFTGDDALQRYGGTAWVVTDLGEVWRVTIRDMVEMSIDGPVANLGPSVPLRGDDGPAARRMHAAPNGDARYQAAMIANAPSACPCRNESPMRMKAHRVSNAAAAPQSMK